MGAGPISFFNMVRYARLYKLSDQDEFIFVRVIQSLDQIFLNNLTKQKGSKDG